MDDRNKLSEFTLFKFVGGGNGCGCCVFGVEIRVDERKVISNWEIKTVIQS